MCSMFLIVEVVLVNVVVIVVAIFGSCGENAQGDWYVMEKSQCLDVYPRLTCSLIVVLAVLVFRVMLVVFKL